MIEKQFIEAKKKEFVIKEFIRKELGVGKISDIELERTPLGERIIIHSAKPGLIIGRRGEIIQKITSVVKEAFQLENPQVEILEVKEPEFDAHFIAEQIALSLERFGPLRFKAVAYRVLQRIIEAGALGAELRLSGRLPSERARSWRFAFGLLKKTGALSETVVNKAYATAQTKPGSVGIKVFIVPPTADIYEIREKEINKEILMEEVEDGGKEGKVEGVKEKKKLKKK